MIPGQPARIWIDMNKSQLPGIFRKTTKQNTSKISLHEYVGRMSVTYLIYFEGIKAERYSKARYISMGVRHYLKFHHLVHTLFSPFHNWIFYKISYWFQIFSEKEAKYILITRHILISETLTYQKGTVLKKYSIKG